MKKYFLFFLVFIQSLNINAQSLSIEETINYINRVLSEHPLKDPIEERNTRPDPKQFNNTWDQITLSDEGKFTIYSYYTFFNLIDTEIIVKLYFYIEDLEYDEEIYARIAQSHDYIFNVHCINYEHCISYCSNDLQFGSTDLPTPTGELYLRKKMTRAYEYLMAKVFEDGSYHRKENDPFALTNITIKKKLVIDNTKTNQFKTKIPLSLSDNVFTIKVKIGQFSRGFILDSGASEINITEEFEQQLIAQGIITKTDYLTSGFFKMADGSIQECRRINLKRITVGTFTAFDVSASISNDNAPLLLGKSFLDKFKTWSIDNVNSELTLEK